MTLVKAALFKSLLAAALLVPATAAEWSVPVAGNTYRTEPGPGRLPIDREGALQWGDESERYTLYFRLDRPAVLDLSLEAADGASEVRVAVRDQVFSVKPEPGDFQRLPAGKVEVPKAGYLAVSLGGVVANEAGRFGRIRSLIVESDTEGLTLDYVKSNEGRMFYWGRRGPSVHLNYPLPKGRKIEYAYSELTVPEGEDPIGSYFMANGFGQGYFGIQVKSPTERWVLFSVWSPFHTNNPKEVPEEDRVLTLAHGEDVVARKFGGEGSGGQSFLRYPWKAGTTYRFLTKVTPDGEGRTTYTGWFGEKDGEWMLIASFRRPKTDTWLTGFHSFLENFAPDYGALGRKGLHGNQWVRDHEGTWHELTRARFTGDGTARGRHRLDYAGGTDGDTFFMRNGGFFDDPVEIGSWLERTPTPEDQPEIDFEKLPRG